jgi:hypothetical protein
MSYDDKAHYLVETLIKNRLDTLLRLLLALIMAENSLDIKRMTHEVVLICLGLRASSSKTFLPFE